jgi:predicted small integral membrane protein
MSCQALRKSLCPWLYGTSVGNLRTSAWLIVASDTLGYMTIGGVAVLQTSTSGAKVYRRKKKIQRHKWLKT